MRIITKYEDCRVCRACGGGAERLGRVFERSGDGTLELSPEPLTLTRVPGAFGGVVAVTRDTPHAVRVVERVERSDKRGGGYEESVEKWVVVCGFLCERCGAMPEAMTKAVGAEKMPQHCFIG